MYTNGLGPMPETEEIAFRSLLFSNLIKNRIDDEQRRVIERYNTPLEYRPIQNLMISDDAWSHVQRIDVEPKYVFAHPELLKKHPQTSIYYRGISLLSQKAVLQHASVGVAGWEKGVLPRRIDYDRCLKVSRLYNTVVSCIIEGSSDWSLSNGYRNILATMGISLDGMYRNKIGEMAEKLIKDRIMAWLNANSLIESSSPTVGLYVLPGSVQMRYGSEPDVSFRRNERLIATIEIKGGTDPAGALERLGAMTKSFAETPPSCVNFLIAGVITTEMRSRLDDMGVVKVYELSRLAQDGEGWDEFINELFHHAVRII